MNIGQDKTVKRVISLLQSSDEPVVKSAGTWGSFAPLLAGHISGNLKKTILYISAHADNAEAAADDLAVFSNAKIETFVSWQGQEVADATDEIGYSRTRLGCKIAGVKSIDSPMIISTCVQALMQPLVSMDELSQKSIFLASGESVEMELVCQWLTDRAFERVDKIDIPGQYAVRGGIIDVFSPITDYSSEAVAIRVEFFGDQIESIRQIDLDTQRSNLQIDKITVFAPAEVSEKKNGIILTQLLPPDTIVILSEPSDIQETADVFLRRVENSKDFYNWTQIDNAISKFKQLHLSRFGGDDCNLDLRINSTQQFEQKQGPLWTQHRESLGGLVKEALAGKKVFLYCANNAESQRIREILATDGGKIPASFKLPIGFVSRGFVIESLKVIVVTHHELFGQYALRRKTRPITATAGIESFSELNAGDYVVHITYGIGKYKGVKTIDKDGLKNEFLTLEYADKAIIHVPISNIALVHKYIGTAVLRPTMSKIGTKKWERQKKLVSGAIAELAQDLLDMQAKRQSVKGITFGADTQWQKEFERSFPYEETADQTTAAEQIKLDMQKASPMDRLLCGDVGYGKTELAIRAAFKAVEAGMQVAILVPTTILCVQHGKTFTQRLADFPIIVETINRFKTKAQARNIAERTKVGKIDILIGTHRILSSDLDFKNLGLLIIDEEQRFGVGHKEKLKKMRINVDVLTMTATPIPRTLHMALLGLRDISSLATPPLDRRAVVTKVKRYSDEMIKSAINFELNRQGQIFFLHNRVANIERFADKIRDLTPDANVAVAHGQMPKQKLENTMIKFVSGKADIMVCSTIIESGIDIPNANTIIINDADRFGLAQLHQLRGRVGRFKNRAYAYMLLPKSRTVTPIAVKRLKAIEEYSQLGAGFKIALRDLEIRGAGNILGSEQSGHINTIGYDLFCRILSDAVARLKKEPIKKEATALIELGFGSYIPRNYISSDSQRLNVYRRIASAKTVEDLKFFASELEDFYGGLCEEIQLLIDIAQIRILASAYDVKSISVNDDDLVFVFNQDATKAAASLFAKVNGKVRIPDSSTVYLKLDRSYFERATLPVVLKKLLRKKG